MVYPCPRENPRRHSRKARDRATSCLNIVDEFHSLTSQHLQQHASSVQEQRQHYRHKPVAHLLDDKRLHESSGNYERAPTFEVWDQAA